MTHDTGHGSFATATMTAAAAAAAELDGALSSSVLWTAAAAAVAEDALLLSTVAATATTMTSTALTNESVVTYAPPYVPGVDVAVLRCSLAHAECAAARWIPVALGPPLLLLGTVGNALCLWLLVAWGDRLRRSAFAAYVASIAVFDTMALWAGVPRQVIRGIWLIDIRQVNTWLCRCQRLLRFGSLDTSSWLLVAVTCERFVSTCFPTHSRYYRSMRRTRAVIAGVTCVMFAWNSHVFWSLDVERAADGTVLRQCGYATPSVATYWTRHNTWLSMLLYSVLPCACMLTLNAFIVARLRRRHKENILRPIDSAARVFGESSVASFASNRASLVMRKHGSSDGRGSKTRMLLPVTLFFFVATLPHFVHAALESLDRVSIHSRYQATVRMLDALATIMQFANNSVNFWIYCLAGKNYRRHAAELLRLRQR